MTTYREINDTEVAVDAPLTQQLMQALKNNPLAIQEGDPTAVAAGKQIVVPPPLAGNNIVAMEALVVRGNTTRREHRSFPIYVRAAGTYRAFMIVSYPPRREATTFIDLNMITVSQFPTSSVTEATNDSLHVDGGDNAIGLTKIIDTARAEAPNDDSRADNTYTLDRAFAKHDRLIVTINADHETGDQDLRMLFGLAVSQEPISYTGAGFDLSSDVTLKDEIDRLDLRMIASDSYGDGFVGEGQLRQRTIVRL